MTVDLASLRRRGGGRHISPKQARNYQEGRGVANMGEPASHDAVEVPVSKVSRTYFLGKESGARADSTSIGSSKWLGRKQTHTDTFVDFGEMARFCQGPTWPAT